MSQMSDDDVLELLRGAMGVERAEPPGDVWPRVRSRIDHRSAPAMTFDWLLIAAAVLLVILQPAVVGILLLHF
jgi:hypothetical protein